MAEEEKQEGEATEEGQEEAPKGKNKIVLFGGGAVAVLALAFLAALMAVPKKPKEWSFTGPHVAPLTPEKLQVNLAEAGRKRYAVLELNVVYDAYDVAYFDTRSQDALCRAELQDAVLSISSTKSVSEVIDRAYRDAYLEEVRQAVDPLLFPVEVGTPVGGPTEPDAVSGIAPGLSGFRGTFRGAFHDHELHIDAKKKTIALDDGPLVKFRGDEVNLRVRTEEGTDVYLDVTGLVEEFEGSINIGVQGRARRILWEDVVVQ